MGGTSYPTTHWQLQVPIDLVSIFVTSNSGLPGKDVWKHCVLRWRRKGAVPRGCRVGAVKMKPGAAMLSCAMIDIGDLPLFESNETKLFKLCKYLAKLLDMQILSMLTSVLLID